MVTFEHDDTADEAVPFEPQLTPAAPAEEVHDTAMGKLTDRQAAELTQAADDLINSAREFKVSDKVTYRETPAVITYKNADGTFDVQMVDEKTGEALRDISDQPRWTPNVEAKELLHRS